MSHIVPSRVKELEKSSKWKQLYPIIKTKSGEIIDGFHRKAADPNWKEIIIDVTDPIEKVKISMEANLNRREVTKEEKQRWVMEVEEELKRKGKPTTEREIASVLGVGKTTIRRWKYVGDGPPGTKILSLDDRKLVPMFDNKMVQLSEKNNKESRQDSYHTIGPNDPYPTLKRRSWFFHEDGREFSLREYARVQEFPDSFIFVGTKEKIKNQIGNAVASKMGEHVAKMIPKGKVIELFAGCGGMSLGFERRGCEMLWMNEFNEMACRTYHANFPKVIYDMRNIEDVKISEIKKAIGNQEIDIIIGGPPCQGFSMAGLNFKEDERNFLYKEFIRILKGIKPKYFVMENVKGILPFKDQIKKDFEKEGYEIKIELIKGEEIKMKQRRHRVFFIGKKK